MRKFKRKIVDFYSYFWHACYSKMFGYLIRNGKKLKVFNFMSNLRFGIKEEGFQDIVYTLLIAFMKIAPPVNFKKKKRGKVLYDVPMLIKEKKKIIFVNKLTFGLLRKKYGSVRLRKAIDVLISAIEGEGEAFRSKIRMQNLALKNRYLLRYLR